MQHAVHSGCKTLHMIFHVCLLANLQADHRLSPDDEVSLLLEQEPERELPLLLLLPDPLLLDEPLEELEEGRSRCPLLLSCLSCALHRLSHSKPLIACHRPMHLPSDAYNAV